MNDRYLFKAKRKNWKELPKEEWWVQGLLTQMWGELHIINPNGENTAYPIDESTICQCTGVRDKAKKLIWENDIVTCDGFIGAVKFGEFPSNVLKNIGFSIDWKKVYYREDLGFWHSKIKVIDSYIDNPELLEIGTGKWGDRQ